MMEALHHMIVMRFSCYDEYSFWRGRWVYRRTVDLNSVTLQ